MTDIENRLTMVEAALAAEASRHDMLNSRIDTLVEAVTRLRDRWDSVVEEAASSYAAHIQEGGRPLSAIIKELREENTDLHKRLAKIQGIAETIEMIEKRRQRGW